MSWRVAAREAPARRSAQQRNGKTMRVGDPLKLNDYASQKSPHTKAMYTLAYGKEQKQTQQTKLVV